MFYTKTCDRLYEIFLKITEKWLGANNDFWLRYIKLITTIHFFVQTLTQIIPLGRHFFKLYLVISIMANTFLILVLGFGISNQISRLHCELWQSSFMEFIFSVPIQFWYYIVNKNDATNDFINFDLLSLVKRRHNNRMVLVSYCRQLLDSEVDISFWFFSQYLHIIELSFLVCRYWLSMMSYTWYLSITPFFSEKKICVNASLTK